MSHITLSHGNGGRLMRELIDDVFKRHLNNPLLDIDADASVLPLAENDDELMITTDAFTVQPLEFPGGDIGSLAVHGTVNDLAVAGATPRYMSLNVIIEEGLELALLERIIVSMARAASDAGVSIVCGDTKVVPRDHGGGLYLATTGIGFKPKGLQLAMGSIQSGDTILLSGPVGDHGVAVMLAREEFGLRGELSSDAATVLPLTKALVDMPGLRFMRDPTRGGLATVLNEFARGSGLGVRVKRDAIIVRDTVRSVCEILGYDPLYLACEGRVVAVVDATQAAEALSIWHAIEQGQDATIIGHLEKQQSRVIMETELGGEKYLEELEDDPLPRIC